MIPQLKLSTLGMTATEYSLQTVIDSVITGFETVFLISSFLNPLIFRHVGSLHGSMGNVGMSVSAQPLLPLGDNHVGMYKQYVHHVHLVHLVHFVHLVHLSL